MNRHVPGTWLLANLLHPFFMLCLFGGFGSDINPEAATFMIGIFFYSLVISLPSLLLGLLAGYLVGRLNILPELKFICWLIIAPLIAVVNFLLLFLLLPNYRLR